MASISLNAMQDPENMLVFTDVPNILKVSETVTGTKATFTFEFNGDLRSSVTADSQYYVTFLGETISNVMSPSEAKNKRFYISSDRNGTAMSVARALRNCGGISADFNVIHNNNRVVLLAKTIGQKWSDTPNYLERNIPNENMSAFGTDGSTYSVFFNSKIDVDIFSGTSNDNNNYITTLEKNFYGDECAFDVSPVLATLADFGKTTPVQFSLQLVKADGEWQHIGDVGCYTTVGFLANESYKYLYVNGTQPLMNKKRGANGTILYAYNNTIPYSVLCGTNVGGWNLEVTCFDSAQNQIFNSGTIAVRRPMGSNFIVDSEYTIPMQHWNNTYYVTLTIGGTDTIKFNVIKPLKATEYFQRVLWRNEYGGISFFDFTGPRSESDSVDIETYEKNVFDYYEVDVYERKKIYKNDYKKTVKLTSHLMESDGRWVFNSLMRSKKVWTFVNGEEFYIIPKSIEVNEDSTYNNIYTATLNYEYSDLG